MADKIEQGAPCIILHEKDNVATLLRDVQPGEVLTVSYEDHFYSLAVRQAIPFGHKIALFTIAKDQFITKYAEVIGIATVEIKAGEHVHLQNVKSVRDGGSHENNGN